MVKHYETVRRCKNGTLIDISVTLSPIRDQNGSIIGACRVAKNITDRKRFENELKVSEERFRAHLKRLHMAWH
ncbi:MAG: PAS domain S-box protein [Nitrosomonadales bacterium]